MNYFINCTTPEEAKTLYKKLVKELHPDMQTGYKEAFQEMVKQYKEFLNTSLNEKQNEYSNKIDFMNYLKTFFKDNPELMQVVMKSIFESDSVKEFINKNSNIIDAGIGFYNLLKQNQK